MNGANGFKPGARLVGEFHKQGRLDAVDGGKLISSRLASSSHSSPHVRDNETTIRDELLKHAPYSSIRTPGRPSNCNAEGQKQGKAELSRDLVLFSD